MVIDLRNDDMSLSEALFIAKEHDEILLGNKTYHEKIVVDKPYITLRGCENSKIAYDDYATRQYNGKNVGTTGSTTFKVLDSAKGFRAFNVTFENEHVKKFLDQGEQAVAFKSECSNMYIKDCEFVSYQDTLYVDFGINNMIENCIIKGDIDFIFGSADCLFEKCKIIARSNFGLGHYTAPNTLMVNRYGLVFNNCIFDHETEVEMTIGRRWYPKGAPSIQYARLALIDCNLNGNINPNLIQMHELDPEIYDFSIVNSKLNGNAIETNPKDFSEFIKKQRERHNI